MHYALLATACLCGAWALWLVAFGGFSLTLLGVRIRSHDPGRVGLLAALALIGYVLAGGTIPVRRTAVRVRESASQVGRHPGWLAGVLAIAVVVVGLACSTRIAGGSDAYGYVSQVDLWLKGDLHVRQPWVRDVPWPDKEWTFTPLGYRPAVTGPRPSLVPTYSPGLPLILSLARVVGGQCAVFVVVPLLGGLGVLCTYGLGRRLGSGWTGVAAGWFLATSPAMLGILMEPLTDVPVMTAWAASICLLLGESTLSVFGAGASAAVAILIRPNLVPLVCPLFLWLVFHRGAHTPTWRRRLVRAASFGSAVCVGVLAVALINRALYGSPFTSGYGRFEDQFAWMHVLPNLRRYLRWFAETQTPVALLGIAAISIPSRRLWPGLRNRSVLTMCAAFVGVLWAEYSAYLEFDSWGYLRFLLPSWPLLMLGLAAAILAFGRLPVRGAPSIAFVIIVALGVWNLYAAESRGVFDQRQAARHEAAIGLIVREHTPRNSVILASGRSGSVRYYAGRVTGRYDYLRENWLDRAIAWMTDRGVHVYVLLDNGELPEFTRRFAGQRATAAVVNPVLVYEPAGIQLFDLSTPPDVKTVPFVITKVPHEAEDCSVRAPMPSLAFSQALASR